MSDCPVCLDSFNSEDVRPFIICCEGHCVCCKCAPTVSLSGYCPICRKLSLPRGGILNRLAIDMMYIASDTSDRDARKNTVLEDAVSTTHHATSSIISTASQLNHSSASEVRIECVDDSVSPTMVIEDLFSPGCPRCFYGGFSEPTGTGQDISWLAKLVLRVASVAERDLWLTDNEYTVLIQGQEIQIMSKPEDAGTGSILVIGHITWTDSTTRVGFDCDTLKSAFELVVGSFDPVLRLVCLRGELLHSAELYDAAYTFTYTYISIHIFKCYTDCCHDKQSLQ